MCRLIPVYRISSCNVARSLFSCPSGLMGHRKNSHSQEAKMKMLPKNQNSKILIIIIDVDQWSLYHFKNTFKLSLDPCHNPVYSTEQMLLLFSWWENGQWNKWSLAQVQRKRTPPGLEFMSFDHYPVIYPLNFQCNRQVMIPV